MEEIADCYDVDKEPSQSDAPIMKEIEVLERLAEKALAEHRAGKTLPLDPDTL